MSKYKRIDVKVLPKNSTQFTCDMAGNTESDAFW